MALNADSIYHNHEAQSMLAKLLATENFTIRHSGAASTASFDIKNRVLTFPVWQDISKSLYNLLTVHETGHAIDTPLDGWIDAKKSIAQKVLGRTDDFAQKKIGNALNVVEDARIDKRQKRRFPGCRKFYLEGYEELFKRNFFGTEGRDLNSYGFMDRFNMYFKGAFNRGIKFSDKEQAFIKEAEDLETWAQVVDFTERFFAFCKDELNETPADEPGDGTGKQSRRFVASDEEGDDSGEPGEEIDIDDLDEESKESLKEALKELAKRKEDSEGEGEGEGEEADSESESEGESAGSSNKESDEKSDEDADSEGEGSSKSEEDNDSEEDTDSAEGGDTGPEGGEGQMKGDDLPDSETMQAWEENQSRLVDPKNSLDFRYVDVPEFNFKDFIDDYKVVMGDLKGKYVAATDYMNFKNEEKKAISFMVKEFETKKAADINSRTSVAKTGLINTNKLHSYAYNDDIFLRQQVVTEGKNHGFVMFIDWSGSMLSNLRKTVKQLMSLTMFCKQINVPFEVYSFKDPIYGRGYGGYDSGPTQGSSFQPRDVKDPTTGVVNFRPFVLRNLLSSRMNAADYQQAMINLWGLAFSQANAPTDGLTGTPLNEAIYVADRIVNDFKKRTNVQVVNTIFLTDGGADGTNVAFADSYASWSRRFINVMADKDTKKTYQFQTGLSLTKTLLERLKDRTGTNLVGFYIYPINVWSNKVANLKAYARSIKGFYPKLDIYEIDKKATSFRDDGFLALDSEGYDSYFLIDPSQMTADNRSFDQVTAKGLSAKKFENAFADFMSKKTLNRVLLSKFISMIAA